MSTTVSAPDLVASFPFPYAADDHQVDFLVPGCGLAVRVTHRVVPSRVGWRPSGRLQAGDDGLAGQHPEDAGLGQAAGVARGAALPLKPAGAGAGGIQAAPHQAAVPCQPAAAQRSAQAGAPPIRTSTVWSTPIVELILVKPDSCCIS